MEINTTLQQRWAMIAALSDNLMVGRLHRLEESQLKRSIALKNPNIHMEYHPATQEFIDSQFVGMQPFWDRKLPAPERVQRWDEFIKTLYRNKLMDWDCSEDIIKEEKEFLTNQADTRSQYAERQLSRLHDADRKVQMNIRLSRKMSESSTNKSAWND